jgi:hypothetical protein
MVSVEQQSSNLELPPALSPAINSGQSSTNAEITSSVNKTQEGSEPMQIVGLKPNDKMELLRNLNVSVDLSMFKRYPPLSLTHDKSY